MLNPDTSITFLSFMPRDNHAKGLPAGEGKGREISLFYPETLITDIFLSPLYFSKIRYS